MSKIILPDSNHDVEPESLSCRRFVTGLAEGTALMGLGLSVNAKPSSEAMKKILAGPTILRGSKFDLTYSPTKINLTGNVSAVSVKTGKIIKAYKVGKGGTRS